MSEYWVSKKKYFCKYCEIFIADDAPSRQHHEGGLRHKGNVERFIRGVYKTGEKKKKDQEEEKRELARVEQAARAAYAQDISSGHAKASSAPVASSSTSAPRKPPTKPSNPFANYSTAQQLGFTDPDVERMELRKSQALVGEWQIVDSTNPVPPQSQAEDIKPDVGADNGEVSSTAKRPAEVPPEDDTRTFKLRKKTAAVGLGDTYDPGLIPIKLKKKEEPAILSEPSTSSTDPSTQATALPKWTAISLKPKDSSSRTSPPPVPKEDDPNGAIPPPNIETPPPPPSTSLRWAKVQWGQPIKEDEASTASSQPMPQTDTGAGQSGSAAAEPTIKTEESTVPVKAEPDDTNLSAEHEQSTTGLFKKRKAPLGGRGRRAAIA